MSAALLGLALLSTPLRAAAHDNRFNHRGRNWGYDNRHHGHDRDEFGMRSDRDRDDREQQSGDWRGDRDDRRPSRNYSGGVPSGYYNPGYSAGNPAVEGLLGTRASLIDADASAREQYQAAIQRGDRVGAKHLFNAINKLDHQVSGVNSKLAGYGVPSEVVPN